MTCIRRSHFPSSPHPTPCLGSWGGTGLGNWQPNNPANVVIIEHSYRRGPRSPSGSGYKPAVETETARFSSARTPGSGPARAHRPAPRRPDSFSTSLHGYQRILLSGNSHRRWCDVTDRPTGPVRSGLRAPNQTWMESLAVENRLLALGVMSICFIHLISTRDVCSSVCVVGGFFAWLPARQMHAPSWGSWPHGCQHPR